MKTRARWLGWAAAHLTRGPGARRGGLAAAGRRLDLPGARTHWLDFGSPSQPPSGPDGTDPARLRPVSSAT